MHTSDEFSDSGCFRKFSAIIQIDRAKPETSTFVVTRPFKMAIFKTFINALSSLLLVCL